MGPRQFPQSRVFSFSSAKDLEAAVERGLHADIAVLDILLGQDDGITVAKRIFPSATQTQVIFITGYVEYCSSVYETEHIYFLLKPIQEATFRRAMEKAVQALEYAKKSALLVKTKTAVQRVPFASIRYLRAKGGRLSSTAWMVPWGAMPLSPPWKRNCPGASSPATRAFW